MANESAKRFKIKPLWVAGLLILVCVVLFLYQLLGPDPAIIVSKETTYITSPLDENGLPDYEAYWMQQASQGVTPENNAAVLIWQALGPKNLDQENWLPLCNALGMAEVPSEEERLADVYSEDSRMRIADWLSIAWELPEDANEGEWRNEVLEGPAYDLIEEAMSRPWTSEQLPLLAKWVGDNEKPLNLLVEAAARPRYYSPSPSFLDGSGGGLISMLLPDIQNMRTTARVLPLRAMQHLGEDRPAQAWQDLRACHRLARLTAQNETVVGQLVAIAVDGVACSGTQKLLHHADLSEPMARQILDELLAMPRVAGMAKSVDHGERLMFLDSTLLVATNKITADSLLGGTAGIAVDKILASVQINWNLVMKIGNSWYDRQVAAAEKSSWDERKQAYARINRDLSQLSASIKRPSALIGGVLSRHQRSKMVANVMVSVFLPAMQAARHAEERGMTTTELTRVAATLAVYRAQHEEYPEQLAELVPEILPEMPLDMYSGKPFIYERKPDGGYLLYSVFENEVDDDGSSFDGEIVEGEWVEGENNTVDYGKSDLVIRMPVPEFTMPVPPRDE